MQRNKVVLLFLIVAATAVAQLSTPKIISSDMVLQQDCSVPIWGKAGVNESVKVVFADQTHKTKADAQGKWKVLLKPMKASFLPRKLLIKGKNECITYDNIVVGEVWLCSGQSNMEYSMRRYKGFAGPAKGEDLGLAELKKPANPSIRVFNMDRDTTKHVEWNVADGQSLATTSAAGYFFGKSIQEKLNVPVGIITSAIGGTRIESWTRSDAYEFSRDFSEQFSRGKGRIDGFRPGNWHKNMIAPLVPFALKGFIWYQGESNCGMGDKQYDQKMKVLAESWREEFNRSQSPFYYVIIGPHVYSDRMHRGTSKPITAEALPLFWLQQMNVENLIENTGFVVVSDLIDDVKDIHPSYKWIVGERLSRIALAKNYGFSDIEWSGPRVKNTACVGDSIIIRFDHAANGLKTNDRRRLTWFEISDENNAFFPALAEIRDRETVTVWHPSIKKPKAVRFGWHETAIPNLVNSEGLPAVPFNTML